MSANKRVTVLTTIGALFLCSLGYADFKYSESSQITGGAMAGMMKFVGAFSKEAKQATAPTQSTIYVKGNRMRRDESMGKVHIIDLDGRRMIDIDTTKRTYSVLTFDQMRAAMEQAEVRAAQEKAKHGSAQNSTVQNPNVKITPKVQVTPTGATRTILNLPTKEVKMRMDMEMESQDPKAQGQKVSTWFTTDSWMAPDVPGYDEVKQFYMRMAKEINWVPGANFLGASGMQISPAAMAEFRKQSASMSGVPLLQYTSMGMAGSGSAGANAGAQQSQMAGTSNSSGSKPQPSATDMVPTAAAAKALGSVLGGFGRKKKKQQEEQASQTGAAPAPPPGAATPGSLMDMTIQVTSFSSDSLPGSLFEIPAGYTQVQENPNQALGAPRR
jgi:hypothetical protein